MIPRRAAMVTDWVRSLAPSLLMMCLTCTLTVSSAMKRRSAISLTSALFGRSTQMLAYELGAGGQIGVFNPLYQIGGPRSIQLAMKLEFLTRVSTACARENEPTSRPARTCASPSQGPPC
jgi:hypothetical protein